MFMRERWLVVEEAAANGGATPDVGLKWGDRRDRSSGVVGHRWKFLASQIGQWSKAKFGNNPAAIEKKNEFLTLLIP